MGGMKLDAGWKDTGARVPSVICPPPSLSNGLHASGEKDEEEEEGEGEEDEEDG